MSPDPSEPPNLDADVNCELQAAGPKHQGDQLRRSGKMQRYPER